MTVPATTRRAGPFNGNGAASGFPFAFKVFAAADIAVVRERGGAENTLVLGADYTVTLNADQDANPGGTVNMLVAPPTGDTLAIVGAIDYDQQLDIPSGGAFRPVSLENALDRTVIQIQQLREESGRTLRVPVTSDANVELPAPEGSKLIGWNATANGLQNYDAADLAAGQIFADWVFDTFDGDGATTAFALTRAPGTLGNIDVSIDGVTQVPSADFSISGSILTFSAAPPNGTKILARYGSVAVQGALSFTTEYEVASGGQTVFTLDNAYTPGVGNIKVYVNGLALRGGVDYLETDVTTVTFTTPLVAGDEVRFEVGGTVNAAIGAGQVAYTPAGGNASTTVQAALRRRVHVEDFGAVGDGLTNDSTAFQAAVDYAESLVGTSAFDAVGVEIELSAKKYLLGSTVSIRRGGIGFRGPLGRGAMIEGNVLLFDVGDPTNAQRIRFVSFENIHFFCNVAAGTTAAVRLYRTIQTQFERCNFSNWNIGVDSVRGSTTHFDRCYWANSLRNVQGQAFIRLSGLDESLFPSPPATGAPGGGVHITDCEFDGGPAEMLYGIQVRSVDGLYITQCHWTDCVYTLGIVPEGVPDSHVILDLHVTNCYFDGPATVTPDPVNVLIGGTVRETVTMASGATRTSSYEKIKFTGCTFRGDSRAEHAVSIRVTDGDSWWDNTTRRLENIVFSGCMFGQTKRSGLFIAGAATSPANTLVEPFGIVVGGCSFYENALVNPTGVGAAINAQAESIVVSNNVFLAGNGTSDFIVNVNLTDAGDDTAPGSAVITGNDFSGTNGHTVRVLNVTSSTLGVNSNQSSNLFPGGGTRIDETYKVTTTDATPTTLWSYLVPQGAAGFASVQVVGSTADGSVRVAYTFEVGFGRNSSGTALSTGTSNWTTVRSWNPDGLASPPTATLSTNTLTVTVTGVAASIDWDCRVDLTRSR